MYYLCKFIFEKMKNNLIKKNRYLYGSCSNDFLGEEDKKC